MPMPSNEVRRNLLPNEPIESFWDVLWLGIRPFLCFTIESRKVVQGTPTGGRKLNLLSEEPIESFWDVL